MTELAQRKCEPCDKGTPPLPAERVDDLARQIPEWGLREGRLVREFKLRNFQKALDLINAIGAVAEKEGHHPDMALHSWNQVRVELYTHSIGGLSENDFVLAAKIDRLPPSE